MRKNLAVVGSKTFDAVCYLYTTGKIEIAFPNQALGWLPVGIKDPKVERHVDGFYVIFDHQKESDSKENEELK